MLSKETKDLVLFFAILFGIVIGVLLMGSFSNQTDFGDAALGNGTVSYFAKDKDGNSIHYLPKEDAASFINGIKKYSSFRTVLFLGNSQSHSINQMELGDNTMSGFLFEELLNDSILFLSASIPNANLQEHYLLYEFFMQKLRNIDLLILPVFFDDFREDGIRGAYFGGFANGQFSVSQSGEVSNTVNQFLDENFSFGNDTTFTENENKPNISEGDFKALNETTQDAVEKELNSVLFEKFNFWRNREEIRGDFFSKLYLGRNTVFNISTQTTRNMIPARYARNFSALKTILGNSEADSIKVLLVIPPLRTDIKYPYNKDEYSEFKNKLNSLNSDNVLSIDLEGIVESKYWGYSAPTQLFKSKDYDFMHFQAEGHRVLADSIKPYVFKLLR
jgi:hypothetical protein